MINPELINYIREQAAAGVSKEDISKTLVANGWQAADIHEAFATLAAPASVPQPMQPFQPASAPVQGGNGSLDPIGELFSSSWRLYTQHLLVLMILMGIPYVLTVLGQLLSPAVSTANVGEGLVTAVAFGPTLPGWVSSILFFTSVLFFIVSIPSAISAIAKDTGFFDSLRQGVRLFFPLFWCGILLELVVIGGFIMLIIPGFMMAVWFFASFFIFTLEGKRGLNALLQSREYVRGYWWAIFGRLFVMVATVSIPTLVIQWLVSSVFGHTAGIIAYYVLTVLTTPFGLAYAYTLYQNLTVLKPSLPATTPTFGRKFLIASAIIGLLLPILGIISAITLVALHRAQELGRAAQLRLESSNVTISASSSPLTAENQSVVSGGYDIAELGVKFMLPSTLSDLTHRVVRLAGDQAVNSVAFSSKRLEAVGCGSEALGYLTYDSNKGGVTIGHARGADLYYVLPSKRGQCGADPALQNWQALRDALGTLVSD